MRRSLSKRIEKLKLTRDGAGGDKVVWAVDCTKIGKLTGKSGLWGRTCTHNIEEVTSKIIRELKV